MGAYASLIDRTYEDVELRVDGVLVATAPKAVAHEDINQLGALPEAVVVKSVLWTDPGAGGGGLAGRPCALQGRQMLTGRAVELDLVVGGARGADLALDRP
jgi:hypothetical protein